MERGKKVLPYITVIIVIGLFIILSGDVPKQEYSKFDYHKAKVIKVYEEQLTEDHVIPSIYLGKQNVELEVLTGELSGKTYYVTNNISRLFNVQCHEGDTIIVSIDSTGQAKYPVTVYSYYREPVIYLLIGLFFLVLLIFGGLKGAKTIVTLVLTCICILFGLIPMLFNGYSPILSAIITIMIVTFSTFILVSGWNYKSLSAILGTISGVIIAGIISHFASESIHLLGLVTDDGERLIYIAQDMGLKIRGLMFSAILIASMGAVMDVAMSISASIFEIHRLKPEMTRKQLYKSGMNVGKDIMGTMSNTLILAFAGGAINVFIFIVAYGMPYKQFMNTDVVTMELIQALSGSIGIVLTVPLSCLYAIMFSKRKDW